MVENRYCQLAIGTTVKTKGMGFLVQEVEQPTQQLVEKEMELAAEATAMMREEQSEVQTTKRIAEVGTNSIKSSQMGEEVLSRGLVEEKLAEAQVLADELTEEQLPGENALAEGRTEDKLTEEFTIVLREVSDEEDDQCPPSNFESQLVVF